LVRRRFCLKSLQLLKEVVLQPPSLPIMRKDKGRKGLLGERKKKGVWAEGVVIEPNHGSSAKTQCGGGQVKVTGN